MADATDAKVVLPPSVEMVHAFFDRLEAGLPTYVSPLPSTVVSTAIAALVFYIAWPSVDKLLKDAKEAQDPIKEAAGAVMAAGLGVACLVVLMVVKDRMYGAMVLGANKQHFANVHWVGQYMRAMRGSAFL